ncbi:peptide cleavage/export ABC transporter [Leuconostoc fallax]|uniref:Uncharacterized protein n=1 Tax=Leuconostoc fallax TaxID=1251 RepID=A0A4R5NAD9_9LACO|nr:peptide cleavage/export ABC transporter [Leuconostoc fallax]MBU7456405.1 peptide cleavage/export ABC transporter [Leuconostoc fallax]TDG69404.1 hypothetical protein C5L23_000866 [Leuconostoc fallax]
MKRFHYISQLEEKDCGVAALAMILKHYGSDVSLANIRERCQTSLSGTTALGLVKAAESFNMSVRPIQADITLFDMNDLPLPFIAHVEKKAQYLHYYVVYGVTKDKILLADPDPSVGKTSMTLQEFSEEWTGVSLFMSPSPAYKPVKENKSSIQSFLPIIRHQKGLIINIIAASFLVTLISIAGSYYMQLVIDTYIPDGMFNTLTIISFGLIATYILQQLLAFARSYLLTVMGQRLSIEVILSYVRHLFELPVNFFATRRTGEIVTRFNDANAIIDAMANTILSLFLDLGITIIVGSILAIQNIQLFLLSLISFPIYFLIVYCFMKPFEKLNQEQMASNATLSSSIIEDINGIETIKSLTSEQVSYQKIDREFVDYLKKSFAHQKSEAIQSGIKQATQLIINVLILWFGAKLVIDNQISIGQLVTYNALLGYFTEPFQNIINLQAKLQTATVANRRLNEVYLVESEFQSIESQEIQSNNSHNISIDNISYQYGYQSNILTQFSVNIPFGEKIALVGTSGSGKSTLAKLLVNFISPTTGTIKIGDQNIQQIKRQNLRQHVIYLPQNPYIFTGSILDNLILGAPEGTTQEAILHAVELADIKTDIENMPQNYQTEISEDGGMSGGQKQRIALARALLSDAPILILDESTSNLDVATEKKIIDNLLSLKDKTIIFIAHRLTIAEKAHRVIFLENGMITEDGNHTHLMHNKAQYYHLVKG